MYVGTEHIDIYLPGVRSLKEKRKYLSSLKARLRNELNLSVAETGCQNLLQRSSLGLCGVCGDRSGLESLFSKVGFFLNRYPELVFTREGVEIEKKKQKN